MVVCWFKYVKDNKINWDFDTSYACACKPVLPEMVCVPFSNIQHNFDLRISLSEMQPPLQCRHFLSVFLQSV